MKYDIYITFTVAATGKQAAHGCLTKEPIEGSLEDAEELRDTIQQKMNHLAHITLVERGAGRQLTLTGEVIKQCVLASAIVEVIDL